MINLISIIIPTYRRPDVLRRSIESVLNQTFQNFEIIVVNDDQFDAKLKKIIEGYNDDRIFLLQNQRAKGGNGARNTGIINSHGSFIAFLDDDDEWLPNYLESKISCINNNLDKNIGLVYGAYLLEDNKKWEERKYFKSGNLLPDLLTEKIRIGASSNIFISKSVIETVGLWDEQLKRQQDLEFLVRVTANYKALSIDKIILKVYGHNDPPPYASFQTRETYFQKVFGYAEKIGHQEFQLFCSNHYRRQAFYLAQIKDYNRLSKYWVKGIRHKRFSFRQDMKILLTFLGLR